jgi:hypothetical protein
LSPASFWEVSCNKSKTSRLRRTPTNSTSYEPTAKNGYCCNEPRPSPSPLTRHLYVARIPTFLLCLDKWVFQLTPVYRSLGFGAFEERAVFATAETAAASIRHGELASAVPPSGGQGSLERWQPSCPVHTLFDRALHGDGWPEHTGTCCEQPFCAAQPAPCRLEQLVGVPAQVTVVCEFHTQLAWAAQLEEVLWAVQSAAVPAHAT